VSRDNAGDNDTAIRELSTAKAFRADLFAFEKCGAGACSTGFAAA
jgi:hypothetical protein